MTSSRAIRSRPSAAIEASVAPNGMESTLVQLPALNKSTIRTRDEMIASVRIVTPKSKGKGKGKGKGKTGKKNVSAAAMLKKQSKVVKNRSPQNEKSFKEAPVPSKYRSRLAKAAIAETRAHIFTDAEQEVFDNFSNLLNALTVNGADDTVFVDSVNDATNTLTAPLEDEQVESIHAREMAHMTRDVLMRERVRFYEEHMKAKEESLNAYFTQMNELEYDMKKLGSHIMGPDLALAKNKIEIVLTESFIEQMKRATRDDYRAIDDLTSQHQEMDDSFMDYLRETEMFERNVRNLKANLFESII